MAIPDWHENDRPREKLLKFGADQLSDAELLAIFLRVGIKGKSAVGLAQDLLSHFGNLHSLLNSTQTDFCDAKGLGQAKYVQIKAILEMSKRHFASGLSKGVAFSDPQNVAQYLFQEIGQQPREVFACLLLDQQHQMIHFEVLFRGTVNQSSVYPREIMKLALEKNAAALIVAHNHPSGIPEPSQSDIALTNSLKQLSDQLEIRLLDHFIIGDLGRWVSFAEKGLL